MTIEELQKNFADKQNDIVLKRRSGKYVSSDEDIKEQKSVWDWYKVEEYKITGNTEKIVSEAKNIVETKFDSIRKSIFWEEKYKKGEFFSMVLNIFLEFEESISIIGINKTSEELKGYFINDALGVIESFSKENNIQTLKETDGDLCNLLNKIVNNYYKEVGV